MNAPSTRAALGIDLGGTKIEALLLDGGGRACWRERIATPQGDYAGTLAAVQAVAERGRAAAGGACSVGIGTPGSVDAQGRIKNANSTCLIGQPLQQDLERRLNQPVVLANDANCLALSEATDGAGAGCDAVFAVVLGTGVGAGIAVGGRVLQGPNGLAGEWGHNPLPWPTNDERPGRACYCGRHGCIETWLSGPGLAADHAQRHGGMASALEIAARAAAGDADCIATLARHAERLARCLASVVNLLDPDAIVLAGGVSAVPGLVDAVTSRWAAHVFGADRNGPVRTRLALARHGDASGVRGAAWLGRARSSRITSAGTGAGSCGSPAAARCGP